MVTTRVPTQPSGRVTAGGMLRENTPVQNYVSEYGLWVKREDLACLPPGPPFSKARGVYWHITARPEALIGVLDTRHSQAGHAVARACQILGKRCVNFYPEFKHEPGPRPPQLRAAELGAELIGLPAGRSAILYHAARKVVGGRGGYMMPNALKLTESVTETAREVALSTSLHSIRFDQIVIPASSGTIAAGVIAGFRRACVGESYLLPRFLIHLGYTRSHAEVLKYLQGASGHRTVVPRLIDEEYTYKDKARPGQTPPWPCDPYYDLKAFRWWVANRGSYPGNTLLWNIG